MPPKPKAQGTSKKADAKKKERVIEVRCAILYSHKLTILKIRSFYLNIYQLPTYLVYYRIKLLA